MDACQALMRVFTASSSARLVAASRVMRLQVGMAALAGDGDALSARLQELSARAATLAEIG